MSTRRWLPFLLAVVALARCGGSELPKPGPASVTPSRGFTANATPVVIHGSGFSVRTIQSSSGGAPAVDETFQAWMGDQALLDVHRVDEQTLTATVPSGLSPGLKTLRVQGPFGTSGDLPNAFTVEGAALASISATIAATPATVSVGQAITVTVTVTNIGTTSATGAVPTNPTVGGTGTADLATGPDPASIATLGPGESGTFSWTYTATGAGTLTFDAAVHATDSFSGTTITGVTDPATPAAVTVVLPAALTATLPASGSAAFGQEFTVTMTVKNTGGAAVRNLVPAAPTVAPSGLAALKAGTGPVPASVDSLLPGASTTFAWTFVAGNTPGTVRFSSSASGNDANSGVLVTSAAATSGNFTIGAAGMNASLSAAPTTASSGQLITLTLTVTNPGLADVRNFAVSAPSVTSTDGANAGAVTGPTPAPPAVLAAGQTVTITWTYSPALTPGLTSGHLSFQVTASGTDGFSGAAISAQPTASATVQSPPTLVASLTPARTPPVPTGQPFTVNTGQVFTLSLAVSNTGGAPAVAVTPTPIAGCAAPSPVSATVALGAPVVFLYANCSPAAAGTLLLSASASGTDANRPTTVVTSNSASTTVTVQTPATVTATALTTSPSTLSVLQGFTVTLTLTKTGTATANVTGVSLTGTTCTNAPAMPVNAVGATLNLTWSGCTAPATPQTLSLAGSATWVDTNNGTVRTAGPASVAVPVVAAALVTATSITTTPPTLSTGQTFSITLTLTKSGGAAANVTAATTSYSPPCGTAPVFPINNIGATQTLVWSNCTAPATAQTLALAGSATWEDANVPGVFNTTNLTAASIVVQQPAALSVSFAAQPPATASVGQPLALTVTVSNTAGAGGAAANNVTVTPSFTGTAGATASCTAASPGASSIAGGASLPYTFTCTPLTMGTLSFTATVNGTAANTGTALTAAATTSPATTIQAPAALAVTFASQPPSPVNAGQVISLTANVRNTAVAGGASANGVSVTPTFTTVTGTAAASCSAASPVSSAVAASSTVPFTFTCTPSGAGTLTFTATANGTAANTGTALTAAATTSPATTVLAPVAIAPATASVPPRGSQTFTASGGTGTGFTWSLSTNASGGSINASTGAYTAGATGSVTDVVRVADSLGNAATRNVTVGPGISISGVTTIAPRGATTFTASGGSGAGFTWSLSTNASGGSINASTGAYTAGATGNVTDVVRVVDSLGNAATQNVLVGAGVAISGVATIAPRGSATFTASGGSGTGFTWSLPTNNSGGSINASTGVYTAGATPSVTDVVRVVDSLGNGANQNVAVGVGVTIAGVSTIAPRGTATFTASGGSGTGFTWSLSTNASGGSINASTGAYTAGATASVTDVVRVIDSLGNAATRNVAVGAGVSISGVTTIAPHGTATFTASGGSGTGFTWSLSTNASGGSINASTGAYTAGATANVTDVVRVVDSLGNATTQNVAVGPGVSISGVTAIAPLGSTTFTASGGSGTGFTWSLSTNASGGSINASTGAYTAGATANVTDVVRVVDSLGNAATQNVTVGASVSISGLATIAPRGSATFTASGGSGTGFTWSLSTNASGGSINASTGAYTAGATPSVTDVVRVVDSLGNAATHNVAVGPGVSVSGVATIAPRGSATFTASGGSGTGFTWSLSTNASGGSINASTGAYTAGATPSVTDVVSVVDSLGNAATQSVAVGPGVSISGPATVPVSTSATFTASGGSGTGFTWSLSTNASGGSINAGTGAYTAGATPSVTDVVSVQDSLGNAATTPVSVTP